MKRNQEKQDEAAKKLVDGFIRRCNVADSILRYSFRLDMPDVRKMPKQENLVDWVGKSAYELFDPLVGDRPSRAFGVICSGSLNHFDGRLGFFKKNAVVYLYCQLRELIGKGNPISAYDAVEYTYFESDKKNIKDGVITGMDYLIQNKIYSFQPGKIIINKNGEDNCSLSTDSENKKSSGNHALNTSIQRLNKKLKLMPYFNGFFVEGPSEFREDEGEIKGLKLSDLDVAAVFRRKSKSFEKINIIKEVQETHNKAESGQSNDQIAKKVIVGIVETYKDLIELRKEDKLTSADRLYIRIRVEQVLGVQLVMRLWNNVVKVYNTMGTAFFDKESVTRLEKIFKCNNILNRAELVDMAFETLKEMKEGNPATTWKENISNAVDGNWGATDRREDIVQTWKYAYEEGADFFSEWCIPLYNTCFCVLLYSAVKNETKDSAEILKKMFAYLSSYINENEIEFESGISEDTLLELKKIKRRPEMIRALSEYIIGMLDQPETMEAPITLFELDKMIPKKVDGDYLNYMKLLFIERNQPVIGWSPNKN